MQPLIGLNFAYGSNLDRSQLLRRCPQATLEGPVTSRGYRLEFFGAADLERTTAARFPPSPGGSNPRMKSDSTSAKATAARAWRTAT